MTKVCIPGSVTTIGEHAFSYNTICDLELGVNVTEIHDSAFFNNAWINVDIPDNVTLIGSNAFHQNWYLDTLSISEGAPVDSFAPFPYKADVVVRDELAQ